MAFNSSILLNALTVYIDQLSYPKINTELVLEGRTAKLVNNIRGIKYGQTVNVATSNLVLQPAGCGLISPTGSFTLTQATLQVCPLMVNESICLNGPGSLEQYWTGMKMPEGSYYDQLTPSVFAEAYTSDKINKLQDINEFLIWQGDTGGATYGVPPTQPNNYAANANQCNGFLHYLTQTSASMSTIPYSGTYSGPLTQQNAFAVVFGLIQDFTNSAQNAIDQEDVYLFMSYTNYRNFIYSLFQLAGGAGNFWYQAIEDGSGQIPWSYLFPGTNIRLIATSGLVGSNYMVLTPASNFFVGMDGEDDADKFQIWHSLDYNTIFFRSMWKIGVTVAYPQYVAVYTGK